MIKSNFILVLVSIIFQISVPSQVYSAEISKADSLLKAKKHFSFAVQYKKNEKYEDAFRNYETSIAYNDTVYQVHYSFADLLLKMNKSEYAKRELMTSFTLNPGHFKSASILASQYYKSAVYDSALVMYEAMYAIRPDQDSILSNIASLREFLNMTEQALESYEELIAKGMDSYGNLMKASVLAAHLENYELSEDYAARALEKKPEDIDALNAALDASMETGDMKSAEARLRLLAAADSTGTEALVKLENMYRANSDTGQLIWALTEHHKRVSGDIGIIGELAELLISEGESEQGVTYIREGLTIAPGNGRLRILMGVYYRKLGHTEKALEEFRIALKDSRWQASAQQFIWQIEQPETDIEKAEREFFNRGNP